MNIYRDKNILYMYMSDNALKKLLRSSKKKGLKVKLKSRASETKYDAALSELLKGAKPDKVVDFGAGQYNKLSSLHKQSSHDEFVQCMPLAVRGIEHSVSGLENKTDELLDLLKNLAPSIDETHMVVKSSEENLKGISRTVNDKLDKLSHTLKDIKRNQPNSVINIVIYYICMYYKLLFTFIRLALEFNWIICKTGNQWGSAMPVYGFCIPHIIISGFSYILFSLIIQGAIMAVVPYPVSKIVNLYPYIFDENMGLQILLYNFGCLLRSASIGLLRVRHLTEPTNRAFRSMAVGMLGLSNQNSIQNVLLNYVREPFNYVSDVVMTRIINGIRESLPSAPSIPMPSFVSSAASGISAGASGLSGVASDAVSGISSVASGAVSGLSSVASGAAQYLPGTDSLKFWKGTGGTLLKGESNILTYNISYPITNKTTDITMFDEQLNNISFLNKEQQIEFNNSISGKKLNKLKNGLDTILQRQLNYIVKQESIRVPMYLVFMEKLFNFIELNIPVFKKGLNHSFKTYNLVIKNNIELISVKVLFPELMNTDPISPVYPPIMTLNKTIKRSHSINPLHIKKYLNNSSFKNILRRKNT